MADPKRRRRGILLGTLAAGAAAGLAVERYLVGRERGRPDPASSESFGSLRGRPVDPVVSFDGIRLHVEVVDGDGPTIVLAHGFSLNSVMWHYQIRDLPPTYRLVMYDARGHGKSEKAPRGHWTLDALARDMEAVIRTYGGSDPVALLGHSMGGMSLLRYCKLFPEQIGSRVGALVLVNTTAADVMGGAVGIRRVAAAVQMIQEGAVRALASNAGRLDRLRGRTRDLSYLVVRIGFGPKASPSVVEFTDQMLAECPTEVWAHLIPDLLGMDVTDVLEVLDVPTLVVAGSHDKITPPGAAERIATAIKRAELVVIRDAGHMSFLERPQSFNAALRAFLSSVPALTSRRPWARAGPGVASSLVERALDAVAREASTCTRCRLAAGRTQVVFGVGNPHADLMFIGEAPGFHEDKQGEPFVGAAGQLLTTLLGGVGLARGDVYIANVLKCLRYNALVQLGDGSWERIGRLVRSRYAGDVMSVDSDGQIVRRRVTGWYASPLGRRRVFRMSYRTARRAGAGRVSIQLTGDHEVLTQRGFVPVQELRPSDHVATGQGMSPLAFDVVCGTLLGDGSINSRSSYLSMDYSIRQRDYARLKASLLNELSPRIQELEVSAVVGGRTYPVIHVRTVAHRALRLLREDFYRPYKRVPWWIGACMSPRMLAFWFMDDGHTRIRAGRQPVAEIATLGFGKEDLGVLQEGLLALGLPTKTVRGRLHFDTAGTRGLAELIAPYVPPSMRYKLHPDIADRISFQPASLEPGLPRVLFDRVDVEDVTGQSRTDTSFFCIDVDETHNFVTAGGVVHNCRPPGNRDPMPDEIESCKPWLKEQIALIDPRVIATLGNFSTQLLLGKKVGITRLRGQRFEWRGRVLIPTYHPAAILRSGSAGVAMQQIEQDFLMIRKTLDEVPAAAEDPSEQLGLF